MDIYISLSKTEAKEIIKNKQQQQKKHHERVAGLLGHRKYERTCLNNLVRSGQNKDT